MPKATSKVHNSFKAVEIRINLKLSLFFIVGKYSYVNAEGNIIEVKYKAGADIGFVVENEQELKGSVEKATNDAAKKVIIQMPESNIIVIKPEIMHSSWHSWSYKTENL